MNLPPMGREKWLIAKRSMKRSNLRKKRSRPRRLGHKFSQETTNATSPFKLTGLWHAEDKTIEAKIEGNIVDPTPAQEMAKAMALAMAQTKTQATAKAMAKAMAQGMNQAMARAIAHAMAQSMTQAMA